jgi:MFS family permease
VEDFGADRSIPGKTQGMSHQRAQSSAQQCKPGHSRWAGFMVAGYALFVLLVGSNIPTPLFPLYARTYGLSALGLTLLFATYTLLVIPSLLLFAPLSDAKGRREVLLGAIVAAALAAGLFAAASALWVLFAAQAAQALALGALQGTAAPTLIEADPRDQPRTAAAFASALTVGGAATGPLLAGCLAQYAVLPLRLAYLIEIGLLLLALVAVASKLDTRSSRKRWRPRRPTVPPSIRRQFAIAGTSAFIGWAVTGLFLALIPSFITETLDIHNLAVVGAVVALMLGSAAVIQLLAGRLSSSTAQGAGLIAMILGVAVLLVADTGRSLPALLIASIAAGVGQGLAFMGSLGDVGGIAPEERKADIVASYYVVVYLGTALPVIGVGALATTISFTTAVQIFAYIVIAICLIGLTAIAKAGGIRLPQPIRTPQARGKADA